MEYVESDIKKMLNSVPDLQLSDDHVTSILYNMLCGIKFLHSANVLHRDLKPANILINDDCKIKFCDFGLARTLPESCIG